MGPPSPELVTRVGGLSKRAPRACESCRSRKVRCDVTRTKAPCTNCRLDSKACVLPISRRRHVGDRILTSSLDDKKHNPTSPICDAIIDFGDTNTSSSHHSDLGGSPTAGGDGIFDVFDLSTGPCLAADIRSAKESPANSNGVDGGPGPGSQPTFLTPYPSPTHTVLDYSHHHSALPAYITPLPKALSEEDLHYLNSKGALDIPDTDTRDRMLRAYVKWVHPFAPMLDLERTLKAIFSDGKTGTVGLLLLQSMLFAATAYLDTVDHRGSRRSLRRTFYERARLLHDFDAETDRLSICQAAILLSYWDGQPDSVRDSYHWIGIATLHANNLGLNAAAGDDLADPRRQRTSRKTWWTLLVRDRLLALALRRPIQNKAFRFDVPMLHLVDFRPDSFVRTVRTTLQIDSLTVEHMEIMTSLWMAVAQLSEYIDRVLNLQYVAQRTSTKAGLGANFVSLVPRMNESKSSEIMACGQELQNWYGYLPNEIQQADLDFDSQQDVDVIRIHRRLLAAYYSMTLMTLYRPLLNLPGPGPVELSLRHESIKMVAQATKSTTNIFTSLYADNQISRLPDTAIAALEPAIATHLLNSTSETSQVRDTSFQKFFLCWRILLQFKETYYLAETTMSMLDAAAKRLKAPPDIKALNTVAFSQLMDEYAAAEDEVAQSYMAVPFVGVVGKQRLGASGVVDDWAQAEQAQEGSSTPIQPPSQDFDEIFKIPVDGALEGSSFDQLLCWDSLEEERLPE